jgi:hypothetical protein
LSTIKPLSLLISIISIFPFLFSIFPFLFFLSYSFYLSWFDVCWHAIHRETDINHSSSFLSCCITALSFLWFSVFVISIFLFLSYFYFLFIYSFLVLLSSGESKAARNMNDQCYFSLELLSFISLLLSFIFNLYF